MLFLAGALIAAGGAALVSLVLYLIFKHSAAVLNWLGEIGTMVMIRLMAFILLCIGIQIMWNGWAELNGIALLTSRIASSARSVVDRIPDDRAGHAVPAAAAAAEFRADDRDHLDAFLAQQRVGVRVAVVGVDHARRRADEVGAAVPLRALALVVAAAGLDDAQLLQAQRLGHDVHERLLLAVELDAARMIARPVRERRRLGEEIRRQQHAVAVGEREHGVEVHRGADLRHRRDDDALGGALPEQRRRELADRLARRALAHADQDVALADRHDVAALQRREAVVLGRVAPPDVDLAGEVRMELVDRRGEDRLLVPRRPVQRVERHAAVDPARRVARVQRVRQRRQQVFGGAGRFLDDLERLAAVRFGEVVRRQAADQRLGELAVVQALEVAAQLVDEAQAHLVGHDLVVEDPLLALGHRHRLGQQVVHFHHLDAAVAHLGDEVEVVALGVLDPQHVVEQQLVAVGRRQARVRHPGRADHHLAQLADFRVHAELHLLLARLHRFRARLDRFLACHDGLRCS